MPNTINNGKINQDQFGSEGQHPLNPKLTRTYSKSASVC